MTSQALLHRLVSSVARQHRGALLPCGAVHGHAVESAVRQETSVPKIPGGRETWDPTPRGGVELGLTMKNVWLPNGEMMFGWWLIVGMH